MIRWTENQSLPKKTEPKQKIPAYNFCTLVMRAKNTTKFWTKNSEFQDLVKLSLMKNNTSSHTAISLSMYCQMEVCSPRKKWETMQNAPRLQYFIICWYLHKWYEVGVRGWRYFNFPSRHRDIVLFVVLMNEALLLHHL